MLNKSLKGSVSIVAAVLVYLAVSPSAEAAGYGAMGDSYADEYQFYPPDRTTARNFVEILATLRSLDFGSFTTTSRGDPRNAGYEYDWALDGATTAGLAVQANGLAQQVAAGKVQNVLVFVGGNDFFNDLLANGGATLPQDIPQFIANIESATDQILAASPDAHVVLSNIPELTAVPEASIIPPQLVPVIKNLEDSYDAALAAAFASNNRVGILDLTSLQRTELSQQPITIDGLTIDPTTPGDDINHLFLADGIHAGTIAQGTLANAYIDILDQKFNAGITPLSPAEIVTYAQEVHDAAVVPLPPAWAMTLTAVPLALVVKRRGGDSNPR
jgi:hypothetical protein